MPFDEERFGTAAVRAGDREGLERICRDCARPPFSLERLSISSLFSAIYVATMLGVTVGFHRHASHGAFGAHPAVRWVLLGLGSMAAQGPLIYWVTNHRKHHHRSDRPGDPHSPFLDGESQLHGLRGLLNCTNITADSPACV